MFFQKLKHGPAAGAGPPQHGTLVGWQILAHRCNDQPSEQCLLISDGDRGFGLSFPVRASNLQAAEIPISRNIVIHLPIFKIRAIYLTVDTWSVKWLRTPTSFAGECACVELGHVAILD